jgi:hypothetical protein
VLTGPAARASLPPWPTTVLGAAGTIVAVWGLHAGGGLPGLILPAFVLTVVVHPLPGWLAGRGAPRRLAQGPRGRCPSGSGPCRRTRRLRASVAPSPALLACAQSRRVRGAVRRRAPPLPAQRSAPSTTDTREQLTTLGELEAQGVLIEEFAAQKAKILAG